MSYLHDLIVPGLMLPYAGSTSPSGWLLCSGQTVSRTTYAALFEVIGTTYGTGDGTTTFGIPDMRGRAAAGKDNMGGTAAGRLNINTTGTTANASNIITAIPSTAGLSIGMAVFGAGVPANATISDINSGSQITISSNCTASASGVALRFGVVDGATLGATGGNQAHTLIAKQMPSHTHGVGYANNQGMPNGGNTVAVWGQTSYNPSQSAGSDQAHPNVQPTMVTNYVIKT